MTEAPKKRRFVNTNAHRIEVRDPEDRTRRIRVMAYGEVSASGALAGALEATNGVEYATPSLRKKFAKKRQDYIDLRNGKLLTPTGSKRPISVTESEVAAMPASDATDKVAA